MREIIEGTSPLCAFLGGRPVGLKSIYGRKVGFYGSFVPRQFFPVIIKSIKKREVVIFGYVVIMKHTFAFAKQLK